MNYQLTATKHGGIMVNALGSGLKGPGFEYWSGKCNSIACIKIKIHSFKYSRFSQSSHWERGNPTEKALNSTFE